MKWISIHKAFPQNRQEVLLFDQKLGLFIGCYTGISGSFVEKAQGLTLRNISHWMPLPARPAASEDVIFDIRSN